MTGNRNLKRRIRGRAAKTGESYTAARRHLVNAPGSGARQGMILAAAQMPLNPDPGDIAQLRNSGTIIRALMRQARAAGAHLVHFPEGALTSPHKRVMSSTSPESIGPADWGRADWAPWAVNSTRSPAWPASSGSGPSSAASTTRPAMSARATAHTSSPAAARSPGATTSACSPGPRRR